MDAYFGDLSIVRLLIQRSMAAIYLIAFIAVRNQFKPLLGERGLLPVPEYLRKTRFRETPSIFHWRSSDRFIDVVAWTGIAASIAALTGLSESGPWALSMGVWLLLWILYLSIVNVGQTF